MKNVIIFTLGLLSFPILLDAVDTVDFFYPKAISKPVFRMRYVPSYGLSAPFIQQCTKDVSKNGHGWVFVNREYFKCGKLSILISDAIYGEKTQ